MISEIDGKHLSAGMYLKISILEVIHHAREGKFYFEMSSCEARNFPSMIKFDVRLALIVHESNLSHLGTHSSCY